MQQHDLALRPVDLLGHRGRVEAGETLGEHPRAGLHRTERGVQAADTGEQLVGRSELAGELGLGGERPGVEPDRRRRDHGGDRDGADQRAGGQPPRAATPGEHRSGTDAARHGHTGQREGQRAHRRRQVLAYRGLDHRERVVRGHRVGPALDLDRLEHVHLPELRPQRHRCTVRRRADGAERRDRELGVPAPRGADADADGAGPDRRGGGVQQRHREQDHDHDPGAERHLRGREPADQPPPAGRLVAHGWRS